MDFYVRGRRLPDCSISKGGLFRALNTVGRSHVGTVIGQGGLSLQWAAETAPRTSSGSSKTGPLTELCAYVLWFAWLPAWSGRSGEKHKGEGWASRLTCPSKNKFGSECCLLRWTFWIPEPFVGAASTRLRGHCSEIACLLPGSVWPAHALLSASASWAEPTLTGALLE